MIVNLAVYIVLILSFQHHPVVGKFPATIATKGEATSDAESKVHRRRQLKKETKSKSKKVDQSFEEEVEGDVDMIQEAPTIWPTYSPSIIVSDAPTHEVLIPSIDFVPTAANCGPIGSRPTISWPKRNDPVTPPSSSPLPVTFRRGDLRKDITRFGFKVSKGVIVRMIAKANLKINLANGEKSPLRFHSSPDGAAVLPLNNGGYVYVSNSELTAERGGVYGIYFDRYGNVVDYKKLLSGTTRNCSGGTTPWGTFVSCEEYGKGQCWQVDPDPSGEHHLSPQKTKLGGGGGNFEAVACDDRNPSQPIFFVTEDHVSGALRKYTPPAAAPDAVAGWDALHAKGGITEFLVFLDGGRFRWTSNEAMGRRSQEMHFPNVEGISFRSKGERGLLYFVSKRTFKLYVLDLDNGTYTTSTTDEYTLYTGEFKHSPDQLVRNDGHFLYFTEDGGKTPGVYAIDAAGQSFSIFEAYDQMYFNDETTGLAFSPDGTKMYASFQDCGCEEPNDIDCGCLFVFWRDDGQSFDGDTMSLKFHSPAK